MVLPLLIISLLAAGPAEKPIKPLPLLTKEPKLDGELKDLTQSVDFKMPEAAEGSSASLKVRAAFRRDTLYLGLTVSDDVVLPNDQLEVTLYFPDSGTTSRGYVYRFGRDGARANRTESGAPAFADKLVQAATKSDAKGFVLEVAFAARSMPRFQGTKPLAISICAEYADFDSATGEAVKLTSCPTGEMPGGPTRLPDEFRKNLKLAPPASVEGIEGRATGWVGFSKLHSPNWVEADAALTPDSLAELVAGDDAVEPKAVALPIPAELKLNDNRPLFTVLTGKNPYSKDSCNPSHELRMAMYLVKNTTATRVLEWPAATCGLGRAMRFELGEEGTLAIGYTNGVTQHFVWADEHFERSELGLAVERFSGSTM